MNTFRKKNPTKKQITFSPKQVVEEQKLFSDDDIKELKEVYEPEFVDKMVKCYTEGPDPSNEELLEMIEDGTIPIMDMD